MDNYVDGRNTQLDVLNKDQESERTSKGQWTVSGLGDLDRQILFFFHMKKTSLYFTVTFRVRILVVVLRVSNQMIDWQSDGSTTQKTIISKNKTFNFSVPILFCALQILI